MNCLKLKAISFAFSLAAGLPVCAEAMQWPDTAQTLCYDNTKVIPCPTDENSPFYGQDAQYQGTARSYTKLGQGGVALPDDATEWIMVRDNVTGLTWEMKNNDDETGNYVNPHDADNTYAWCPYDNEECLANSTEDQINFLNSLNSQYFGGYNDWRVPTLSELLSIVYTGTPPLVDWKYFPLTYKYNTGYYTDTKYLNNWYPWMVYFMDGSPSHDYSGYGYIRAVRGGK